MGTKSFLDFMFLCSVCDFLFDVRGLQSMFCLSRHRYGPFSVIRLSVLSVFTILFQLKF